MVGFAALTATLRGAIVTPRSVHILAGMKTSIAIGLFFLGISCAHASSCESRIEGTWKSDGPVSMAYLREHTVVPPKVDGFLESLFGKMTLTFAHGELRTHMPDTTVNANGKPTPFGGAEITKPYHIVFCDDHIIAVVSPPIYSNKDELTVFHFVNPDAFWLYMGSTDPKMPDINSREFFRRTTEPGN